MYKGQINILLFLITALISFNYLSCRNNNYNSSFIYWCSNNSDEITFAKLVVEDWNKKNPGRKVIYQPVPEGQSSEEVILAAVVGGTTPAIYSNMWQGDVELYARAGKLIALDSLEGFLDYLYERCDTAVIKEITSTDGHIYQIPWKINPIMLIYNEGMFKSIGLSEPPRTYSEFFSAGSKIKIDKDGNGYTDRWISYAEVIVTWWQRLFDFYPYYLAASNGAPLIKDNKVVFNNEYAIKTFAFLKTLFDKGYMPRERLSARQDPFLSGDIATRFTGPWEIVHADKFKPKGFEYNFSPLPVPDDHSGNVYTYGDTKNIVIFNNCPDIQLAWDFLRSMISPENDFLLLKTTSQLPRRKDLMERSAFINYFNDHPKMVPFAKQSKYVRGPDNCEVLKEVFDIISQEYEACVIYGKKSPEEAINDAANSANLLLLR